MPKPANHATREEYNALINVRGARKTSASSENHAEAKALFQAIRTIRSLQTYCPAVVFDSTYKLDVFVIGKTRADEDNIRKAINDSLQGVATRNDRDSRGGITELCDC